MKSSLNKTIDFDLFSDLGKFYSEKLLRKHNLMLENQIIWCEDSISYLDNFESNIFDLIIVDPPYNLNKNYDSGYFKKIKKEDYIIYTESWLSKVYRLLKEKGTIYICLDWESSIIVAPLLSKYFIIQNRITWQRDKGRGSKKNYKNNSEDIWFCTKSNDYVFNANDIKIKKKVIAPYRKEGKPKDWYEENGKKFRNTYLSNLWTDIVVPFWSMPENTGHPTQKPEELISILIKASSNENDLILDPFVGSGTTCVVSKKLKRRSIGLEKSKTYCCWGNYRLDITKI